MTLISKLGLERMKDDAYERGKRDGAAEERERCLQAILVEMSRIERWQKELENYGGNNDHIDGIAYGLDTAKHAIRNQEAE